MKRMAYIIGILTVLIPIVVMGTYYGQDLGPKDSPTFAGATISGLTASKPVFTDASKALTSVGTLPVDQGGTGATTLTDHGILLGSGTGPVTPLGSATNGQLPIGSTGADPVLAALTEGEGIDITNGAGTIEIKCEDATDANKGIAELSTDAEAVTGSATDKVVTPANLTARLASPGAIGGTTPAAGTFTTLIGRMASVLSKTDDYTVLTTDFGKSIRLNAAVAKTFTLPSVAAADDGARLTFIKVGAGRMTIDAADTDYIFDSAAGGTIYSDSAYATITIEYCDADTRWYIISAVGTWTTT